MNYNRINKKIIDEINHYTQKVTITLVNTKKLNSSILNMIRNSKCFFKILGGIADIPYLKRYEKRITYSIDEMKKIINSFELIESKLPNDDFEKILYIYNYLRKNIQYDDKEKDDRKIRSLRTIYTCKAVCSGYSLLLKELLERQGIKCKYIKYYNHIWNHVLIKKRYYEVDLTWDACVYKRCKSSNLHYFGNNYNLGYLHHNYLKRNNYLCNDLLNEYKLETLVLRRDNGSTFKLLLLPIGKYRKYYLYEDDDNRLIVKSDDDLEIVISKGDKEEIGSYINCFFSKERIEKYMPDYDLGYMVFKNNCFYRKKPKNRITDVYDIKYDNDIIININNSKYIITKDNRMERIIC